MEKWKDVKTPPDVIANRILAEAEKKQSQVAGGTPSNIQPSSASSMTSTQTFPSIPFQMPAIHFHTGALMNGTGAYMASPSKPMAPRKPPADQVSAIVLDSIPGKHFPAVREFLATVDQEEADGGRFAELFAVWRQAHREGLPPHSPPV